jgi:hypothetical protein
LAYAASLNFLFAWTRRDKKKNHDGVFWIVQKQSDSLLVETVAGKVSSSHRLGRTVCSPLRENCGSLNISYTHTPDRLDLRPVRHRALCGSIPQHVSSVLRCGVININITINIGEDVSVNNKQHEAA